jgi:hypothetical protein
MSIDNLRYVPVSAGTLTLNGATPVVVSDADVLTTSVVVLTLNTLGGNPPLCQPFVSAKVANTSFSVRCIAGSAENSVYNWVLYNPQA